MDTTITTPGREAYDKLQRQLVEVEDALKKIKRGEQEYKNDQTKETSSSTQLYQPKLITSP